MDLHSCSCIHTYIHIHIHTQTYMLTLTQMLKKVRSGKVTFKLADTAEKAKKLVTVGGLSEASAEGRLMNQQA